MRIMPRPVSQPAIRMTYGTEPIPNQNQNQMQIQIQNQMRNNANYGGTAKK